MRCTGCNAPIETTDGTCPFCGTEIVEAPEALIPLEPHVADSSNTEEIMTGDSRYRSLYCSSDDKVIFGLAGGLAHRMNLPASAMRFIFFLVAWSGLGFLFYFVGLFLPKLPTKNVD